MFKEILAMQAKNIFVHLTYILSKNYLAKLVYKLTLSLFLTPIRKNFRQKRYSCPHDYNLYPSTT